MTSLRCLLTTVVACLLAAVASAQSAATGTLSGRVTDAAPQLALSGARVGVAGTSIQTFADQGGDYLLQNVPAGTQTVIFSYVGYAAPRWSRSPPDARRRWMACSVAAR